MAAIGLAPLEKHRLSDQIVDRITDLIREGAYADGARLPSERELAQSFAVSRPLVREALRIVESLGLISVRLGIGAIVTRSGRETADVAEFFCKHPVEVLAMLDARDPARSHGGARRRPDHRRGVGEIARALPESGRDGGG